MKNKLRAVEVRVLWGKYLSTFLVLFATLLVACFFLRLCCFLVLLQLISKAVLVQISVPFFPVLNYSGTEEGMCSIASVLKLQLLMHVRLVFYKKRREQALRKQIRKQRKGTTT